MKIILIPSSKYFARNSLKRRAAPILAVLLLLSTHALVQAAPDVTNGLMTGNDKGLHEGYLTVYSASEAATNGDTAYFPHSSYEVLKNGKHYLDVENHLSILDENPTKVALPSGEYTVVAKSEHDGVVRISVAVKTGRRTVLRLERGSASEQAELDPEPMVKLSTAQHVKCDLSKAG